MNFNDFFNELLKRWSAEKPEFFKKLQQYSLYVLAIAALPMFLTSMGIPVTFIPGWLSTLLSALGGAAALISQFTATASEKVRLLIKD